METRILRGTGLQVSRVCLGTMTFGQQVDEVEADRILGSAMNAGVNFVDTADVYVQGESERIVGKILRGKRDAIVLASKVGSPSEDGNPRTSGLNKWHIIKGVEESLERLQTDCLDILYLHRPDRSAPIDETLAACDLLVRQGKAHYIATSNHASWKMMELDLKSESKGYARPSVMQVPYNLITRSIEDECLEYSAFHDVGVVVYNALAGGLLTGKHSAERPIEGRRFDYSKMYYDRYWNEKNFQAVEALKQIASLASLSLPELSFRWLMTRPLVDSILVGASSLTQWNQNLSVLKQVPLSDQVLEACDHVWNQVRGAHFLYYR